MPINKPKILSALYNNLRDHRFVVASHFALLIIIYHLLYALGLFNSLPNDNNMRNWDGYWYSQIIEVGYWYVPYTTCNLAFFPLFPYLWKALNISAIYMGLINLIAFYLGLNLLIPIRKASLPILLAMISLPSCIFFFLPYSESLFFISGALLLNGLYRRSTGFVVCGIVLCGLTRSVSTTFIPAFLFIPAVACLSGKISIREMAGQMALTVSACLASIFAVAYIQFYQTGKWFYFLEVQRYWKRHWLVPSLPFTTTDPNRILGIDAAAIITGFVCIFFSLKWFSNLFKRAGQRTLFDVDPAAIFSILILGAIAFLNCVFTFNIFDHTSIWSANRLIFCTPFFFYFIYWLNTNAALSITDTKIIVLIIITGIWLTGVFRYPLQLLFYALFSLSLISPAFKSRKNIISYFFYAVNFFLSLLAFDAFLSNKWLG